MSTFAESKEARTGIEDLDEKLNAIRGGRPPLTDEQMEHIRNRGKTPCIYFIQEGTDGPIKIGAADRPKHRLSQLQMGNVRALRFAAVIAMPLDSESGLAPRGFGHGQFNRVSRLAEKKIHAKFAALAIRGEWFRAEPPLTTFIEELVRRIVAGVGGDLNWETIDV